MCIIPFHKIHTLMNPHQRLVYLSRLVVPDMCPGLDQIPAVFVPNVRVNQQENA